MNKLNRIMMSVAAFVMIISLAACADKETEVAEDSYSLEWEEIEIEQQVEDQDEESSEPEEIADTEKEETENVDTQNDRIEETVPINNDTEETASVNSNEKETADAASKEAGTSNEESIIPPEAAEEPLANQQAQNVSVPSTTIVGSIKSLGDGSFTISKADIDSNVMVSTDETVNVVYSDSTEFEVTRSSDGGITASYAAGTSADLQTGRTVNIVGVYEGSSFVAQKITIRIFG